MTPEDIALFIHAAEEFFRVLTGERPEAGDARIDFATPALRDYTGVIQVSGMAEGVVCCTADDEHLSAMLETISEDPQDAELKQDLIGELAGTVVMNVREHFGSGLQVDVPRVYTPGNPPPFPEHISYTIPLQWGGAELNMVLALNFPKGDA